QAESVELKRTNKDTATKPLKHGMRLPLVPLRDIVIFPEMICSLYMGRERSMYGVEHAAKTDRRLLLIAQRNPADENPTLTELHSVGVVATLIQFMRAPDGTMMSWVQGQQRATI